MDQRELLELCRPLRVADVVDGLDWVGIRGATHVDAAIRPVWRPVRAVGLAVTVRWIPTTRTVPRLTPEEYTEFVRHWYQEIGKYPFGELIEPGSFLMVDAAGTDCGIFGSNNVLAYMNRGAVGICTDGGCRDTDEIILQRNPVWCRHISRTMVQGRVEFHSMQEPVLVGGVLVRPGDVVVADGDGVVVVPQETAADVARYAHQERSKDRRGRRRLYEAAGMPLDDSVLD
jgi:4-hydroxy-4-methyl-2-oxoglutarate aldolase